MFFIILIKCIIVGNSICKLYIYRWKSCFHQLKIYKQSSRSAITVNERMDALKHDMKTSQFCHDMLCTFSKITQQLFRLRLDKIRLNRFMLCTHNTNRNNSFVNYAQIDYTIYLILSLNNA